MTLFQRTLEELAQAVRAGPDQQILLVLDQAGWPVSRQVQVPVGIRLGWLPPFSPELQLVERLWPLTNAPLVNRRFQTLNDLGAVQAERCLALL